MRYRFISRSAAIHISFLIFLLLGVFGCAESPGNGGGEGQGTADMEGVGPPPRLPEGAEAMSLLGEPLFPPELPEEVEAQREEQLQQALTELEANPSDAEALIWAGRRYAYLGEYRQAIEIFTRGIGEHPDDPRFYRHRGHRFITVREFDRAIRDFRRAAELIQGTTDQVEPDGQPNALNIPTSTLHFNIHYHYGLAHFIKGEFEDAESIYRLCWEASVHADSKVATAHWLYMTLRRLGREEEAQSLIRGLDLPALGQEIIESGSYLELLQLYAQGLDPEGLMSSEGGPGGETAGLEGATVGFGLGNRHLVNERSREAREIFLSIVAARDQWAAFGYIAAEADLARMGPEEGF